MFREWIAISTSTYIIKKLIDTFSSEQTRSVIKNIAIVNIFGPFVIQVLRRALGKCLSNKVGRRGAWMFPLELR